MHISCLLLASALTLSCAKPAKGHSIVHERRDSVPEEFIHDGAAPKSTSLDLRIALVSNDLPGLEKALYAVSTPNSDLYGKHLSKNEGESFVAPSSNTTTAVNNWLASHGLTASSVSPAGDWLGLSVDVNKANELFDADFSVLTHEATGQQSVRTLSYSIPTFLQGHIEFVHPTTAFPVPSVEHPIFTSPTPLSRNISSRAVPEEPCSELVTPACLQALYSIPTAPASQSSNKLGVTGLNNHWAQEADLQLFLENLRPDINSSTTFTVQSVDGGTNPQGPGLAGTEANLDTQYTIGLATGVPVTFISVGTKNTSVGGQVTDHLNSFLDEALFLLAEDAPPQVLTTSAGFTELNVPIPFANKLCTAYLQLGARGVSTIFGSGDGSVSGSGQQSCTTFNATFPSTCQFVTSVGATSGISPETAANFSSGGFSAPGYFKMPSYQATAVQGYLSALGTLNSGKFNPSGRAFPDVSAQGTNIGIANGGRGGTISGTSCSSPIFASVIALINAELIAAGRSPLGFLNPFLYSDGAKAFTDITIGDNPGCNTTGFPTMKGWDPVTGLGTPNYTALREAVGL